MEILCWLCMLIAIRCINTNEYALLLLLMVVYEYQMYLCAFPLDILGPSTEHDFYNEFTYKYRDHVRIQTRFYVLERTFLLWKYWHTIYLYAMPIFEPHTISKKICSTTFIERNARKMLWLNAKKTFPIVDFYRIENSFKLTILTVIKNCDNLKFIAWGKHLFSCAKWFMSE